MKRRSAFLLILILAGGGSILPGQQTAFPYGLEPVMESMLVLGGSFLLFESAVGQNQKLPLHPDDFEGLDRAVVNPFDRPATHYWDPTLNRIREKLEPGTAIAVLAGSGIYGLADYSRNRNFNSMKTLSLMYLEGLYLSSGTMLVAKAVVNRPRPYVYNTELPWWERYRGANNESFFSGNATVLFYNVAFFSTVFSDLFPDSRLTPWIWGGSLALAGVSGFLSVRSGMHYPTDVIAGAIIGGMTGFLIPLMHKEKVRTLFRIAPWASSSASGIRLLLKF